ncbi:hypothetical protein BJY24_005498 [Nocardia transvalensis]|uniref:Uncharacterized protein n=1 Tax=Nocardia transvalensis TaxID=37333 RepID=A0A7W9PI40_9NOCA|nr:hypothetical protein [Nocardia transvalensis]MBB5916586.1 hypothetical protein [Nocardia transvalensis]
MSWTRTVVSLSALAASGAAAVIAASGQAAAEPRDCTLDRTPSSAAAQCGGDGSYILEVDCFGLNLAGGSPIFGPYNKSVTGYGGPGSHPARDCVMPLTLGQIGIATDARITPFPTRPGLPPNAWEYDPGRR